MLPPEPVADHDGGRAARLLICMVEETAQCRMHAQGGEVRRRDQLPPDPLRAPIARNAEGHRRDICERRREQVVQLAVAPVRGIRRRRFERDQLVRIPYARKIAQHPVHLAIGAGSDTDSQAKRDQRDGREARRAGQHAQPIADVLPQFGQVFGGHAQRDIQQQAREAEHAVTLPDFVDGLFGDLHQFVAVCVLEFVGKCSGQRAVHPQADRHGPVRLIHHDSALLSRAPRLAWMTRTRSSSLSLSAASTRRPNRVSR